MLNRHSTGSASANEIPQLDDPSASFTSVVWGQFGSPVSKNSSGERAADKKRMV